MLSRLFACLVLSIAPAAAAEPQVIDGHAAFPEGPFVEGGKLFYTQYAGHTVSVWNGQTIETLWSRQGCGPSAVQRFGSGFLVTCYDDGSLAVLSGDGKTENAVRTDDQGAPLVGPNDITLDGKGGAYFTASGPWEPAPIVGKVLHLTAEGQAKTVADDLHYANGLALSTDGASLFVNESEAGRVIRFKVEADGSLSDRRLFVRLTDLGEPPGAYPDGIKFGPDGNIYIGLYSAGRVLAVSAEGKLVRKIEVPSAAAPNLAFSEDGRTMFITAVDDTGAAPYPGKVYAVHLH